MQNEESLRLDSMSKIVGVLCVIIAKKCYEPFVTESHRIVESDRRPMSSAA